MTLHEIAVELYGLSGGLINSKEMNEGEIEHLLNILMQQSEQDPIPETAVMTIYLPDGEWYFSVFKNFNRENGYGYWIPANRAQEFNLIRASEQVKKQ